jgi:aminoglycoside phosphotransferase (APT) family kinase protein
VHLPDYRVETVVELGQGQENVAYQVNGELIVRYRKEADAAERAAMVQREMRLLALVAQITTLAVPRPLVNLAAEGWLVYRKLGGTSLLELPPHEQRRFAASTGAALGELLRALHAIPLARVGGLVETDNDPLARWRAEAAELAEAVSDIVPPGHRRAITAFFDAALPEDTESPVFSHNDLGIEHVLVDPATGLVSGIIDWSDAAVCDAAYDLGLLYRDLGPAALDAALRTYAPNATDVVRLRERAIFYARCSVFEDLAYGRDSGRAVYVAHGLDALTWLFPTSDSGPSAGRS